MRYLVIIILLLSSCAEQRCARHARRAKEMQCLVIDSTVKRDTTISVVVTHDTTFKLDTVYLALNSTFTQKDTSRQFDTLKVLQDGIKATLFIDWKARTAKIALKIPKIKETVTVNNNKDSTTSIKEEKKIVAEIKPLCPKVSHFWCIVRQVVLVILLGAALLVRLK